jgi:hypothetical protein
MIRFIGLLCRKYFFDNKDDALIAIITRSNSGFQNENWEEAKKSQNEHYDIVIYRGGFKCKNGLNELIYLAQIQHPIQQPGQILNAI